MVRQGFLEDVGTLYKDVRGDEAENRARSFGDSLGLETRKYSQDREESSRQEW